MAGGSAIGLALALHFVAALDAETSAGLLPSRAGVESELALTQTVTPSAGWVDTDTAFRVGYAPRAYWRIPNTLGLDRPAVLHQLHLGYGLVREAPATLDFSSNLSVGEVDYSAVSQVFGEGQTSAPEDPFLRTFSVGAGLTFVHQLSPRWSWGFGLPVSYHTSYGSSEDEELGATISLGLDPNVSHALTEQDSLTLASGVQWVGFAQYDQLMTRLTLGWSRRLTERVSMATTAGVGRMDVLSVGSVDSEESAIAVGTEPSYFAIASWSLSRQRQLGTESISVSMDTEVDPLRQTTRPRITVNLSTSQQLSPTVSVGANAGAFSSASSEPLLEEAEVITTETGVFGGAGLSWAVAVPLTLRFGVRGAVRGSHWSQRFDAREEEVAGFAGLSWAIAGSGQ